MPSRPHPISAEDTAFWKDIRGQFYLRDDTTYLQGGTVGPSARPTIEHTIDLLRGLEEDPLHLGTDGLLQPALDETRQKLAAFVNAPPEQIALVLNTTMASNIPAQGLTWERGTEILMSDQEYPAIKNLWQFVADRDGLTIRWVSLPVPPEKPEELVAAYAGGITDKTSVMIFSHVYFTTGLATPIKALTELAHSHDAVAFIDGAHAVGMMPLDLKDVGCDFYISSTHKWLLAPKGTGFLYLDAKYQDRMRPVVIGHNIWPTGHASRYDVAGTRDVTHFAGLGKAIDFQNEIGWESKIRPYCLGLSKYLKEQALERIRGSRLTIPLDPSMSGFITSFTIEGIDLGKVCQILWEDYKIEVTANSANDLQFFRVSTHFYDSYDDVDRFIDSVNEVIKTREEVRRKDS